MNLLNKDINIEKTRIKEKNQEADLYYCYTDKFKTFYTSVIFLFDYNEAMRPVNILLAYLLDRTTSKHPNEEEFVGYLYNLYDMMHNISQNQIGLIDYITFRTGTVNTKYIHDDINLLDKSIELLEEAVFCPNFDIDIFEEIKESLIENIKNKNNNKVSVAYDNFFNEMFKNELINTKALRDISKIEKITLDDVKNAYQNMLKMPHIYFYVGEDDKESVINKFNGFDFPLVLEQKLIKVDSETKDIISENLIVEEFNVNQSNIFVGYRTSVRADSEDYYAMHVLNLMIGDYSNSDLFKIVREEHGLSYNIYSVYNPDKGYMIIKGGIAKDNFDLTFSLVKEIIEKYQTGNISEEALLVTKKGVVTAIISSLDTFSSTYNSAIAYAINGKIRTLEEKINAINNITIDDIQRVANTLTLDTVYFMKGNK